MGMWRPRLKSVIAVVLLWQLAAPLLAGPAFASAHLGSASPVGAAHCHTHDADGAAPLPAPATHSAGHAQHTNAPDCCQGVNACDCVCAQGTIAIPQLPATTIVVTDQPARTDLHSPPLTRRSAEVFRPPI